MIKLSSVVAILVLEALGGLILTVAGFLFFSRKKNTEGQSAAKNLIDKIETNEQEKAKNRQEMIAKYSRLSPETLKSLIGEISDKERVLYQQIIQMFLNKDEKLLREIDQHIDGLSKPYFKMIEQSSEIVEDTEKLQQAEQKLLELEEQNQKLSTQLKLVKQSMDDITEEYSQIFNGTQTELELRNSSRKMFKVFNQAEKKVRETFLINKNERYE